MLTPAGPAPCRWHPHGATRAERLRSRQVVETVRPVGIARTPEYALRLSRAPYGSEGRISVKGVDGRNPQRGPCRRPRALGISHPGPAAGPYDHRPVQAIVKWGMDQYNAAVWVANKRQRGGERAAANAGGQGGGWASRPPVSRQVACHAFQSPETRSCHAPVVCLLRPSGT